MTKDGARVSLRNKLIKMREQTGYENPFMVSKELLAGSDTIYKIEKGDSIPTKRTRRELYRLYKATKEEIDDIERLIVVIKK
jgi:DNA-binding XRE family transcriptional regulator